MTTLKEFVEREKARGYIKGWGKKLYLAQKQLYYSNEIRIKAGDKKNGDWSVDGQEFCHDCGAKAGEYHVPGCDTERCPKCKGQKLSCDCES